MWKKLRAFLLSLSLLVQSSPVLAKGFSDVPADAWYASYVNDVSDRGVINGYDSNRFGPNDILTRGMVAMILFNKEGAPEPLYPAAFLDVAGKFYEKAANWLSPMAI